MISQPGNEQARALGEEYSLLQYGANWHVQITEAHTQEYKQSCGDVRSWWEVQAPHPLVCCCFVLVSIDVQVMEPSTNTLITSAIEPESPTSRLLTTSDVQQFSISSLLAA